MVFSVAQSLNPRFPKLPKLLGAPKTFGNFGFPCVFLDFQQKSKKHMEIFGFSAEIQKNPWKFFEFSAEIQKKAHGNFWIFNRNPPKKKHGNFWILSRNPKKHMEIQNFPKFCVHPIVLEILDLLEILDFLKFWYVVTTDSPLFNKLLRKSLYKIISGHVFRIRDLIDF